MPMYCNNFELEESRDDFLLRAEPPEAFALYPSSNPGPPGPPGPGLAPGGTTGQVLVKASDEDFDTEWSSLYNKADVIVDSVGPAAIASFPDGANDMPIREITATIVPQQDLHGYGYPWPAGGGTNILNLAFTSESSTVAGMTFTHDQSSFTLKGTASGTSYSIFTLASLPNAALNTDYTFSLTISGTCPGGLYGISFYNGSTLVRQYRCNTTDATSKTFQIPSAYDRVDFTLESLTSGLVFDCTIKVQFEKGSTKTTWSPYSNICPIIGHTGVTVNNSACLLSFSQGGLNDSSGTENASTMRIRSDYIPISELGQTINTLNLLRMNRFDTLGVKLRYFYWYTSSKTFIENSGTFGLQFPVSIGSNAIPSTAGYFRIVLMVDNVTDISPDNYRVSVNAEQPIPISWQTEAGTIYSGYLQIKEDGNVEVTSAFQMVTFEGSDSQTWGSTSGTGYYQFSYALNTNIYAAAASVTAICDSFQKIQLSERGTKTGLVSYEGDKALRFALTSDMGITTTTQWKTWCASNPVHVLAPLLNPITYTLGSIDQLFTKLGANNIWFNTGNTSVTYPCDTKLYIDKKIAALA